jgi:hypothetical protein
MDPSPSGATASPWCCATSSSRLDKYLPPSDPPLRRPRLRRQLHCVLREQQLPGRHLRQHNGYQLSVYPAQHLGPDNWRRFRAVRRVLLHRARSVELGRLQRVQCSAECSAEDCSNNNCNHPGKFHLDGFHDDHLATFHRCSELDRGRQHHCDGNG